MVAAHLERSAYTIHFGMNTRERYTQPIDSQQTRAFARDCSVRHAKSRPSEVYSMLSSERHAARFRLRLHLAAPRSRPACDRPSIQTPQITPPHLLISLDYEPFQTSGTAPNRFQTTQTTKPSAAYISRSRMNTEPNHALEPTTMLGTSAAEQPLVPSTVVAQL